MFHVVKMIKAVDVPALAIGSVALMEVKEVLGITSLCLTVLYMARKWYREEKQYKQKKETNVRNNNNEPDGSGG